MLNRTDWYAPWFNRSAWIFDHIETLGLEPYEILTLLAINYLQENNQPITPETIAAKSALDSDHMEAAFASLTEKGCLIIDYRNKQLNFILDCMLDQSAINTTPLQKSLLGEVQSEFGRPLSASEMERLTSLCAKYEESMILHALDESAAYDKRSISYIEAVLAAWTSKGLSAEDIEKGMR